MKFGLFYEMETPRPWHERSEYNVYWEALAQIELADRIGFDYVWEVEHPETQRNSYVAKRISQCIEAEGGQCALETLRMSCPCWGPVHWAPPAHVRSRQNSRIALVAACVCSSNGICPARGRICTFTSALPVRSC